MDSLSDVEAQLEAMGGSASTVSHITTKSVAKSTKSFAAAPSIAEGEE